MRLHSYVVARDYGFAPNPFYGVCTLATCKPIIRAGAGVGDWVLGTGSKRCGLEGKAIFAMRVTKTLHFDEYWSDERFQCKRPSMHGSLKQAYGDNIYWHAENGAWLQAPSHHSLPDGSPNSRNISTDTSRNRVLVSDDFLYWGGSGREIPARFRDWDGLDVCTGRQGQRSNWPDDLVREMADWLESFEERGHLGRPGAWPPRETTSGE
jgi:hypothetical protein